MLRPGYWSPAWHLSGNPIQLCHHLAAFEVCCFFVVFFVETVVTFKRQGGTRQTRTWLWWFRWSMDVRNFWSWSLRKNLHSRNLRWNPNMMVWTCVLSQIWWFVFFCKSVIFTFHVIFLGCTASSNLWERTVGQNVSFCDGNIFLVYHGIHPHYIRLNHHSFFFWGKFVQASNVRNWGMSPLHFLRSPGLMKYSWIFLLRRGPVLRHPRTGNSLLQHPQWRTKTRSGGLKKWFPIWRAYSFKWVGENHQLFTYK